MALAHHRQCIVSHALIIRTAEGRGVGGEHNQPYLLFEAPADGIIGGVGGAPLQDAGVQVSQVAQLGCHAHQQLQRVYQPTEVLTGALQELRMRFVMHLLVFCPRKQGLTT